MSIRSVLSFTLAGVLFFAARNGNAQVVAGGGPKATDCWVTFDSVPAPNSPAANPRGVRCADQNATCGDADARYGYCQFQLEMTLNSDTFAGCSPTTLPSNGFLIPYSGPDNDDHPKNIADFEFFQQFADDTLPLGAAMTNVASAFSSVTIPMKIAFTAKGPLFRTTTVKMHPTMCTAALDSRGHCPPGAPKDVDTFNLTCTPPIDAVTGKPISACTGISSTFQQLQEHIFDRKCSSQASCHGSAIPPHNLCLKPSCNGGTRSAYTDLVGVPPANFAAQSDGLLRVTTGDPAHSFIIHKIEGGPQLNSTTFGPGAYGLRMPYNNPTTGRARPKLTKNERQLINDWILAGAPQMGFVATTAKGACQ